MAATKTQSTGGCADAPSAPKLVAYSAPLRRRTRAGYGLTIRRYVCCH